MDASHISPNCISRMEALSLNWTSIASLVHIKENCTEESDYTWTNEPSVLESADPKYLYHA